MECTFLYIITIIASPTLTSAAATTIIKNTNNCASTPLAAIAWPATCVAGGVFENATNKRFTELSISSIHIKIMMALRRVSTPVTPIQNKIDDNVK